MSTTRKFLSGEHPKHGTLYAAVDPNAHHIEARVAERRFVAFLTPFRDEDEALAALLEAGAVLGTEPQSVQSRATAKRGKSRS